MHVFSTFRVRSALGSLSGCAWDAEVELIAVSLRSAVRVALASVESLSLAGDTDMELVADVI